MKNRKTIEELDTQFYSTKIVQELLDNQQWQKIQDIIPLSFKAINDIIVSHSQALQDIRSLITSRASKAELTAALVLKCNISDFTKTLNQISLQLQQRPTYNNMNDILRDYITKQDLNKAFTQINSKLNNQQRQKQQLQIEILKTRMDQFQKQIIKKIGGCATLQQLQQIQTQLNHKANINDVNQALQTKVNKQYLTSALQKKANKDQIDLWLSKKAEASDITYIVAGLQSKVSLTTLQKLTQVIQNKADKSDLIQLNNQRIAHSKSQQRLLQDQIGIKLQQMRVSLQLQLKQIRHQLSQEAQQSCSQIKNIQIQIKKSSSYLDSQIMKKNTKFKQQVQQQFDSLRQTLKILQQQSTIRGKTIATINTDLNQKRRFQEQVYSQIDQVRRKLQQGLNKGVQKRQFIDFKSEITQVIQNKAEIQQVQSALDKFQSQINVKIGSQRQQMIQGIKISRDQMIQIVNTVTNQIHQLRKYISKKSQKHQGGEQSRKLRKQIQDCRKTIDTIFNQMQNKLSLRQYQVDLVQIKRKYQVFTKQLSQKANIKDVCVLADSKPNIDDVNLALKEVNQALTDKVTEQQLQTILKDQAIINQTLCAQNIVGRWLWQSGQQRSGGLLPWQVEAANTVPDHYFWQKDKTSILVIISGIYHITSCIFGGGTPVILVNGQAINQSRSEQNVNNLNIKKQKKKKQVTNYVSEYIMLPSKSRISVLSSSQANEGFLNIKRL